MNWFVTAWVIGAMVCTEKMGDDLVREVRRREPTWSEVYAVALVTFSLMLWPIFGALSLWRSR